MTLVWRTLKPCAGKRVPLAASLGIRHVALTGARSATSLSSDLLRANARTAPQKSATCEALLLSMLLAVHIEIPWTPACLAYMYFSRSDRPSSKYTTCFSRVPLLYGNSYSKKGV